MKSTPDRDLLLLFKNEFMSQQAIDQEVDCLNKIFGILIFHMSFAKLTNW